MRNHQDNTHPGLSPLSVEILGYLEQNPRASDTLVGIARWWVLRQRIEAMTTEVKGALDQLVALGLVVRTSRAHAQPVYRLNHQSLSLIRSLLSETK